MREPDWDALADLQFMFYNRIAGALNEAISSIALNDMPEAQDKPPGYWRDRATGKVVNVLNLFTAWSYLIRYKRGEPIPERAIRPFRANDMLRWIGLQLQINPVPQIADNPLLRANQETLQEALLMLYSAACTQGAGVRIEVDSSPLGTWFRMAFTRNKAMPTTLDALLASFGEHWRAQDTAFELMTARDFIALNNAELMLVTSDLHGEFTFFVRGAEKRAARPAQPAVAAPGPVPGTKPLDPAVVGRGTTHPTPPALKTAPRIVLPVPADAPLAQPVEGPTPVIDSGTPVAAPAAEAAADAVLGALGLVRPLQPQTARHEQPETGVAAKTSPAEPGPQEASTPPGEPAPPVAASEPRSIIRTITLPEPAPPSRFLKPPAATSNVALTGDTPTQSQLDQPAATSGTPTAPAAPTAAPSDPPEAPVQS